MTGGCTTTIRACWLERGSWRQCMASLHTDISAAAHQPLAPARSRALAQGSAPASPAPPRLPGNAAAPRTCPVGLQVRPHATVSFEIQLHSLQDSACNCCRLHQRCCQLASGIGQCVADACQAAGAYLQTAGSARHPAPGPLHLPHASRCHRLICVSAQAQAAAFSAHVRANHLCR